MVRFPFSSLDPTATDESAGALQEYILRLAQSPSGGLRDKPGKPADAYHTAYNLSGLSSAQSNLVLTSEKVQEIKNGFRDPFEVKRGVSEIVEGRELVLDVGETEAQARERMRELFARGMGWVVVETVLVGGAENEVVRPCSSYDDDTDGALCFRWLLIPCSTSHSLQRKKCCDISTIKILLPRLPRSSVPPLSFRSSSAFVESVAIRHID